MHFLQKNWFIRGRLVIISTHPICKVDCETVLHALWQCPVANDVWSENGSVVQKWTVMVDDVFMFMG